MNYTEPPEKFVWRYEDKDEKIFEQVPIHLPLWDPMAELLKVE